MRTVSQGSLSRWQRRALLTGGAVAVAGWVIGAPQLQNLWSSDLSYRPLPGLSPFRELERKEATSTAAIVFAGLGERDEVDPKRAQYLAKVRGDPCSALYGELPSGMVPVALFSDVRCPNCRTFENMLDGFKGRNPGRIHVIRHHLPLLGASSVTAARVALAARNQGREEEMWRHLMGVPFMINAAVIRSAAEAVGLQPEQVLKEMDAPHIDEEIRKSRAIAEVFGFYGTPATIAGRTAFMGDVSATVFEAIVVSEDTGKPIECRQIV